MPTESKRGRQCRDKGPERERWYTIGELSRFLGKDSGTVALWFRQGRLPQPEHVTPTGWKLWSPEQAAEILRRKPQVWFGHPWEGQ